jgi:two-component system sensor histidine kinase EvgS
MNGVLIKPLSLMTLENELARYFSIENNPQIDKSSAPFEEYSFDIFANLLKQNPAHLLVILDEILKVHEEVLLVLKNEAVDEEQLASMIHKIKGGAQLLSAQRFVRNCEQLEQVGSLSKRVLACIDLLEEQNKIILSYQARYTVS